MENSYFFEEKDYEAIRSELIHKDSIFVKFPKNSFLLGSETFYLLNLIFNFDEKIDAILSPSMLYISDKKVEIKETFIQENSVNIKEYEGFVAFRVSSKKKIKIIFE